MARRRYDGWPMFITARCGPPRVARSLAIGVAKPQEVLLEQLAVSRHCLGACFSWQRLMIRLPGLVEGDPRP